MANLNPTGGIPNIPSSPTGSSSKNTNVGPSTGSIKNVAERHLQQEKMPTAQPRTIDQQIDDLIKNEEFYEIGKFDDDAISKVLSRCKKEDAVKIIEQFPERSRYKIPELTKNYLEGLYPHNPLLLKAFLKRLPETFGMSFIEYVRDMVWLYYDMTEGDSEGEYPNMNSQQANQLVSNLLVLSEDPNMKRWMGTPLGQWRQDYEDRLKEGG